MTVPTLLAFDCDVVLKDGTTLTLRPGTEEGAGAVLQFLNRLSDWSLYQRFAGAIRPTLEVARHLVAPGAEKGFALVGEHAGQVVAVAGFYFDGRRRERAEVAFAIADDLQGKGIGTRLLERLAQVARQQGVQTFDAFTLAGNRPMLGVFLDSGFEVRQTLAGGVVHVTLSLAATEAFVERAAARAQTAAAASLRPVFHPRSVAIVGASRARGKIGSEILHNLVASGFRGAILPVHPISPTLGGLTAYRSITAIPGPVDLAVVAVPSDKVLAVVDDCIAKGVRGICVISAGFAEAGTDGLRLEAQLVDRIRAAGCRLIGPNCMGLLNTDPAVALNATFSPVYPPAGSVAMSTQSGALGLAILDYARRLGIGISSFVSIGNKADVSGNDLLQYWAQDERTHVILLYLESFGNPRKFSQIARRVGRTKPIIAVKAGRSRSGARAAASHTGALAVSDTVVEALFRQSGVIRTDTLEELFDVAALLASQPLPRGRRVAVLTNAGGPGILAADACEGRGLSLATLGEATRSALRAFLPASASVGNPIDMLASAPADHYRRAGCAVLADDQVDALLVIFIPPIVTDPEEVARAVQACAEAAPGKPVLGVFMRSEGAPAGLTAVPCYAFPESAANALSRAAAYAEWRSRPVSQPPAGRPRLDCDAVRSVIDCLGAGADRWLAPREARELMGAAGIAIAPSRDASGAEDAAAAARALGFPVAVKAAGASLLHKTERHAVLLNVGDEDGVRAAYADLSARLGADMEAVVIQQMVPPGPELLVGATVDPLFGPVVVCGSGGVLAELVADSAVRLTPVSAADAAEMVGELRSARLLRGYRGSPALDEAALHDVIVRVAALVDLCPEIVELDINPLTVLEHGALAVDVRIRVEPRRPGTPSRRIEY